MACVHNKTITWPPPASVTKTSGPGGNQAEVQITKKTKATPSVFSTRVIDLCTIGEIVTFLLIVLFFLVLGCLAPVSFVTQLLYFILGRHPDGMFLDVSQLGLFRLGDSFSPDEVSRTLVASLATRITVTELCN